MYTLNRTGYLTLAGSSLDLPDDDWTIAGLVYHSIIGTTAQEILYHVATPSKFSWLFHPDGDPDPAKQLRFIVNLQDDLGVTRTIDGISYSWFSWRSIVLERQSDYVYLYVGDAEVGTDVTGLGAITLSGESLRSGTNAWMSFASWSCWHRALDYRERAGLALGYSPRFYQGLVWHLPFLGPHRDEVGGLTVTPTNVTAWQPTDTGYYPAPRRMPSRPLLQYSPPRFFGPAIALELPAPTADVSGTHVGPVYTGASLDLVLPQLEAAPAGTFVKPVYTCAAIALGLPAVQRTIADLYADAIGELPIELPALTPAVAGTHQVPVYTAAGVALTLPAADPGCWGTRTPPTHDATPWLALPVLTCSIAGTYPTWDSTGLAPELPAATAAIAGTHAAPVYSAAIALALPAIQQATSPNYARNILTLDVELPALQLPIAAWYRPPTYTAAIDAWLGPLEQDLAAAYGQRTWTGRIDLDLPATESAIAGGLRTYHGRILAALPGMTSVGSGNLLPGYHGQSSPELPVIITAISGTWSPAEVVYSAAIGLLLPGAGAVIIGTAADPVPAPVGSREAWQLGRLAVAIAGTHTGPTFTAAAVDLTLRPAAVDVSATYAVPVYTTAIALALPALACDQVGELTEPVYAGQLAGVLPGLAAAASGTHTAPTYTGSLAVALPAIAAAPSTSHTTATYTAAVDLTLPSAIVAAAGTLDARARCPFRVAARAVWQPAALSPAVWQPQMEASATWQPTAAWQAAAAVGVPAYLASIELGLPTVTLSAAGTAA